MRCPNCNTGMEKISTHSHYGSDMDLDQCPGCGGIWCDDMEMWAIPEKTVDKIDVKKVAGLSSIKKELFCPRCGEKLEEFKDPYFPEQIKLDFCLKCNGFWLNRGELKEFKEWQENRKVGAQKDEEFGKQINAFLNLHQDRKIELIGNLAKFLNLSVEEPANLRSIDNLFYNSLGIFLKGVAKVVWDSMQDDSGVNLLASPEEKKVQKQDEALKEVHKYYIQEKKKRIFTILAIIAIVVYIILTILQSKNN